MGMPPFRPVNFGPMDCAITLGADGSQRVTPRTPLPALSASLCEVLSQRADRHPDRVFLAQRRADGSWETATYQQIKQRSDAIAQSLLDRRIDRDRAVLILSPNSIEFAEMVLGCMAAQIPVAPVSPPIR